MQFDDIFFNYTNVNGDYPNSVDNLLQPASLMYLRIPPSQD